MDVYLKIWFCINTVVYLCLIAWKLEQIKNILNNKNK